MTKPAERVDIAFRYSALGDLVLCSGFVKKHAQSANAVLYFVTQPAFAELVGTQFPSHPCLRVVNERFSGLGGLWSALRAGHKLGREIVALHAPREVNFYDLHDVTKSRAFALGLWLALAPHEIRTRFVSNSKAELLRRASIWAGRDLLGERWIYLEHQRLLPGDETFTPELTPASAETRTAPTILLAPAASKWKKEWPSQHWQSLIRMLQAQMPQCQLRVVAPDEHALTHDIRTSSLIDASRVEWSTSLKTHELSGVAAAATVGVCSNSAWLHLCEATGTPVLALEGPIVRGFGFAPWHAESVSLEVSDLPCRPCTKHGGGRCRLKGERFHACMNEITPQRVFDLIAEKMDAATRIPQ
ncbi:MAG TPA: glycosyltransferase family 9 protein [Bdellovibrionota bacterium]|nr:glycosyltransferase family 9 protein [Bdellovibrionota bacterium]